MPRAQTLTGEQTEALAATLLEDFLAERAHRCQTHWDLMRLDPQQMDSMRRIMEQPRALRVALMRQASALCSERVAANRLFQQARADGQQAMTEEQQRESSRLLLRASGVSVLITEVCRRSLPFTAEDILAILETFAAYDVHYAFYLPALPLFQAMRAPLADPAVLARCRPALQAFRAATDALRPSRPQRDLTRLLEKLLAPGAESEGAVQSTTGSAPISRPSSR